MATNSQKEVTGWVGWVYFAGFMMVVMGIFQTIAGLTALLNDKFYVVSENSLAVFNFTAWGWIHLILGIIVLSAGSAIIGGHAWGRVVGVVLATLSLLANFLFITAYPIWSIVVMVIDVLIIYALTVHGSETNV